MPQFSNELVCEDPMTTTILDFCWYNLIMANIKPRFSKWFLVTLVLLHTYWPPLTDLTISFHVYSVKVAVDKDHHFNQSGCVHYRIAWPLYNSIRSYCWDF